ncbi:ATP-binding protein, partial [Frankia sp. Cas8]|uniref:ATP-binding protein n=1 Tax=unclassified Frankia TaxID=2632575 RepID=UPI003A0FFFE9
DEGGRGLQLVAELATHWGARPTRTGKTVWFQLDTPDTDQANSLKAGSEALPRRP